MRNVKNHQNRGKLNEINEGKPDRPILFKDGKVVDQDATVIQDSIIAESMRYISKMTRGLSTGVLSQDEEYIKLQDKIIEDLIVKKSAEASENIEKDSKRNIRDYAEAHRCHQDTLDKMHLKAAQVAKDNGVSFFVDDDGDVCQTEGNFPIVCSDQMSGKWKRINCKELKDNIEDRLGIKVKEVKPKNFQDIANEADALASADKERRVAILANKISAATMKQSKKKTTKKKTIKKVVAKKKKAKKRDRR